MVDSTTHETWSMIQETLVECALELFEGAVRAVGPVTSAMDEVILSGESVVAVIGYGGDDLKGALMLQASRKVSDLLQPPDFREPDASDAVLRDVMGELANQLLGRMKNKLLQRGIVLSVATPMTALGSELRVDATGPSTSAWHAITLDVGPVLVRFDATMGPDFRLAAPAPPPEINEGDMLFF